ncbi:thioredoxin O1, mitochondrial isoform X2 [Senna tora]|uniref:Thioredoxin O1, mitochondrial isoform X2 n=1 Tax=Senna tora TaxID=362788 RepID=A0A835CH62_9FABA|nr:thioredoxin O1, mitochondrial isoform X2 [Senna tora]
MQREMARNLILRSSIFRRAIDNRLRPLYNHLRSDSFGTFISTSTTKHPSFSNSSLLTTAAITFPQLSLLSSFHSFCSDSVFSGPSNIALVKSEEEFKNILSKVQDESLPAIFYFTAVWCGPCRFISPVIAELSEKYPHVTTYKIDIDQPTLHFFQNGKKADELIGADVGRLKYIMEKLYK